MTNEKLTELFRKYMEGRATKKEMAALAAEVLQAENDTLIRQLEEELWETNVAAEAPLSTREIEKLINAIDEKRAPVRRIFLRAIAAAASVILLAVLATFWMVRHQDQVVATHNEPKQDVPAPDVSKAILRLADGQTIYVDSVPGGEFAQQGISKLVKLENGQISYQATKEAEIQQPVYNTLTNPRGSKVIHLRLADGSLVWLNAGSSITFPAAFVQGRRIVTVTGEVYFEVRAALDRRTGKRSEFIVESNSARVKVLGTHFNVQAYDDEPGIQITLLEGAVIASNSKGAAMLTPGQQCEFVQGGMPQVRTGVDMEMVMAWKNGEFQFGDKMDIHRVMRQLARWYDLEIEYQGEIKGHVGGAMSRGLSLVKILESLEKTGLVKFEIAGKKITVKPS